MKKNEKQIIEKIKYLASGILVSMTLYDITNDRVERLKSVATNIDDLYDNYKELLEQVKEK